MSPGASLALLMTALLWLQGAAAAPVAVRYMEGVTRGFLALRTLDRAQIASGDLLQFVRRGEVESRMVFRFKDGSVLDDNGMILTIAKNLPREPRETVHLVAFTPTARLIELEVAPAGEHKVLVGELEKSATHYVFKPRPGAWLELFSTLLGRMPPDSHAWIVTDELPAFVRFEGPLHPAGPVWRIELTSPRWPD
jgi:hypothetical protein